MLGGRARKLRKPYRKSSDSEPLPAYSSEVARSTPQPGAPSTRHCIRSSLHAYVPLFALLIVSHADFILPLDMVRDDHPDRCVATASGDYSALRPRPCTVYDWTVVPAPRRNYDAG